MTVAKVFEHDPRDEDSDRITLKTEAYFLIERYLTPIRVAIGGIAVRHSGNKGHGMNKEHQDRAIDEVVFDPQLRDIMGLDVLDPSFVRPETSPCTDAESYPPPLFNHLDIILNRLREAIALTARRDAGRVPEEEDVEVAVKKIITDPRLRKLLRLDKDEEAPAQQVA